MIIHFHFYRVHGKWCKLWLLILQNGYEDINAISNNISKCKRITNSTKTIINYIIVKYKHTNEI